MLVFELSDRKKQILEAVIADYIDTAVPVGSFTISKHYIKQSSPATVRNELADLERLGFITHPHTSAGRIPTDLGYRYYVDHIMETKTVSGKEISLVKTGIRKIGHGLEDVFKGVARVLSSMLNYVTVFVRFGKQKQVYSAGMSNMLKQPEFKNIEQARQMLETLEHEDMLSEVMEEYLKQKALDIRIGHENKLDNLQELSVIVAQYNFRDNERGAFGIIGPTRMNYSRVSSVLSYISDEIDNMLEEF
ncbi:MAG: heat-inducible transcriptional repressor HrcA [Candidatus Margulisbacteria bacterium]|nr:heat-inducible transcriptional repressor HrcA [Candidatus Margulisiibacteriota bacterium]